MQTGDQPNSTLQERRGYVPSAGFVPTANVATRIAEAVLNEIYGEEQIQRQLPLRATLRGETWVIVGTLAPGRLGGTAHIEISKRDGQITYLSHGR
jgi:hypothetical protein